jgi:hypothetical protein
MSTRNRGRQAPSGNAMGDVIRRFCYLGDRTAVPNRTSQLGETDRATGIRDRYTRDFETSTWVKAMEGGVWPAELGASTCRTQPAKPA